MLKRIILGLAVFIIAIFVIPGAKMMFHKPKSGHSVADREQYWRDEIKANLPLGSSEQLVVEFFAARGVKLECCTSTQTVSNVYAGSDTAADATFGNHKLDLRLLVPIKDHALSNEVSFITVPLS